MIEKAKKGGGGKRRETTQSRRLKVCCSDETLSAGFRQSRYTDSLNVHASRTFAFHPLLPLAGHLSVLSTGSLVGSVPGVEPRLAWLMQQARVITFRLSEL
ncbi:innexin [Plakobranchus ocellatus]|uniref:Innexin n=1 Tax=Plakobranchus ocellatus TaxID=259542 RepID=A0AAV3YLC8_9GAST|nr:innexin [Plakobranchus ocellatus]